MGARLLVLFIIAKFFRSVQNSSDLTEDDKTLILGITSLFTFAYILWWARDAWRKAVKRATERAIERSIVERAIKRTIEEREKEREI